MANILDYFSLVLSHFSLFRESLIVQAYHRRSEVRDGSFEVSLNLPRNKVVNFYCRSPSGKILRRFLRDEVANEMKSKI